MNLQPKTQDVTVQKEFLNTTQGLINKVGGLTLNETDFADRLDASGYLKAGSGVSLESDGSVLPYALYDDDGDGGATAEVFPSGIPFVTANDVKIEGSVIVGALESAFLNKTVVETVESGRVVITQEFIDASNSRFHLR